MPTYNIKQFFQGAEAFVRYRSDYVRMMQRLLANRDWFARSIGVIPVLAMQDQLLQVAKQYLPESAGESLLAEIMSAARSDFTENLAYSCADRQHRSPEEMKIEISRRLLHLISISLPDSQMVNPDNPFLEYLQSHLKLSVTETQLLFRLWLKESCPDFAWCQYHTHSMTEYTNLMAAILGLKVLEITQIINSTSKLLQTGLIKVEHQSFVLADGLFAAIGGLTDPATYQAEHYEIDAAPVYDLKTFNIDPIDREIMQGLLTDTAPCNILFYGRPGTGKSELARSLISYSRRNIYQIKATLARNKHSRLSRATYATYFSEAAAIILDEAELLLSTDYGNVYFESDYAPTKAATNVFLESHQAKIIWIVNDLRSVHPSTLRRFDFILKFDRLSRSQRESAIDMIDSKHQTMDRPHISPELRKRLITAEHLSIGILDKIFQTASRTTKHHSSETVIQRLMKSVPSASQSVDCSELEQSYDIQILNTSVPAATIAKSCMDFYSAERKPGEGLNILFHGPPGTGKTELVKYLSQSTDKQLIVRRGSDLLSMWLGETEKQIAAAFEAARDNNAILLIDEADSFFVSRENAEHNYESSRTNEFLTHMEQHNIILVCATNLVDKLDPASLRRFHFKVEFHPMRESDKAGFFMDYFFDHLSEIPSECELAAVLRTIPLLTPGDFRAVRQRIRYQEQKQSWRQLIAELAQESKYKRSSAGNAIGF